MHAIYVDNRHSRFWLGQKAWAENLLNNQDVIYPNGRHSHECALEVLEKAEDELLSDLALTVTA